MSKCRFCNHNNPAGIDRCQSCGSWLEQGVVSASPNQPLGDFDAQIISLVAQGQKIAAIKLYRERTGTGLAVAKNAVEAIAAGQSIEPTSLDTDTANPDGFEGHILGLLKAQRKIEAIKIYRQQTGAGLKQSKDAVEALAAAHGITSHGAGCAGMVLILVFASVTILNTVFGQQDGGRYQTDWQIQQGELQQCQNYGNRNSGQMRETFIDDRCLPLYTIDVTAGVPRADQTGRHVHPRDGKGSNDRKMQDRKMVRTGVVLASYPAPTFQRRGIQQALLDISSIRVVRWWNSGAPAKSPRFPRESGIGKRCAPLHPTVHMHTTRSLVVVNYCQHTSYSERYDAPHSPPNVKAGRISNNADQSIQAAKAGKADTVNRKAPQSASFRLKTMPMLPNERTLAVVRSASKINVVWAALIAARCSAWLGYSDMSDPSNRNESEKAAWRQFLAGIDASYPRGSYVAIDDCLVLAASADFDKLVNEIVAQGRDPRDTIVVEAGTPRPEYVTIFAGYLGSAADFAAS